MLLFFKPICQLFMRHVNMQTKKLYTLNHDNFISYCSKKDTE